MGDRFVCRWWWVSCWFGGGKFTEVCDLSTFADTFTWCYWSSSSRDRSRSRSRRSSVYFGTVPCGGMDDGPIAVVSSRVVCMKNEQEKTKQQQQQQPWFERDG
jgi:hypothetical protein